MFLSLFYLAKRLASLSKKLFLVFLQGLKEVARLNLEAVARSTEGRGQRREITWRNWRSIRSRGIIPEPSAKKTKKRRFLSQEVLQLRGVMRG
jgi:hypothetical protein